MPNQNVSMCWVWMKFEHSQVLVSLSSSEVFFSLLHSILATMMMITKATTNVRADTSQLITMGLITGSGSGYRTTLHGYKEEQLCTLQSQRAFWRWQSQQSCLETPPWNVFNDQLDTHVQLTLIQSFFSRVFSLTSDRYRQGLALPGDKSAPPQLHPVQAVVVALVGALGAGKGEGDRGAEGRQRLTHRPIGTDEAQLEWPPWVLWLGGAGDTEIVASNDRACRSLDRGVIPVVRGEELHWRGKWENQGEINSKRFHLSNIPPFVSVIAVNDIGLTLQFRHRSRRR